MDLRTFLYTIPKVELHCHLAGTVSRLTFLDLAQKNGVGVPAYVTKDKAFDYGKWSMSEALAVYRLLGEVLVDADDFKRATYETLKEARDCGVRYREMSWSPTDHLDRKIPYQVALQGIEEGIKAAAVDFGVTCRLIAGINREETAERATELLEIVADHPSEYVIGVGLDYNEGDNPPERFWKAFRAAATLGLHRTAHACEIGGPSRNVETCLDLLGCERIDHGYRVLEDDRITERCASDEVVFNVVPTTVRYVPRDEGGELLWRRHPIRAMVDRGLRLTINSDDPGLMETSPAEAYVIATRMGFGPRDFKTLVLNGIAGSWLDQSTKDEWTEKWSREIDDLIGKTDV